MVRFLSAKGSTDVNLEFGPTWVYGSDSEKELIWCRRVFEEFEADEKIDAGAPPDLPAPP
jgi:hypothetical protein